MRCPFVSSRTSVRAIDAAAILAHPSYETADRDCHTLRKGQRTC
jgi:hypothetical protein